MLKRPICSILTAFSTALQSDISLTVPWWGRDRASKLTPERGLHTTHFSLSSVQTMASSSTPNAASIMLEFAANTGLYPERLPPRRYLWTDAYAVCNFLGLARRTGEMRYQQLAHQLVEQVHTYLGKHRPDDARQGWISGLSEEEGRVHPTIGGLRIGKQLPERGAGDPVDDDLEWDRDGQYYHYLTKWMHALTCMTVATNDPKYNIWAAELAKTAHAKFTYGSGNRKRMYWKMSIDLSRPQVPSMGHHDPLDGLITYNVIQKYLPLGQEGMPDLAAEIVDMENICKCRDWVTTDALGMGGLLTDAYRVLKLTVEGKLERGDLLTETILESSVVGMEGFGSRKLTGSAEKRLAFRELGLVIGFKAVPQMLLLLKQHPPLGFNRPKIPMEIDRLQKYSDEIMNSVVYFWEDQNNRNASTWKGHLDINMVMWATSLEPEGFYSI
ncbi:uncharacterized protein LOC106173635 [Lingula anatina]|uniref:Uncharacterized protein LOC106173635 n=1 Tax=Lingula anatina TaxID=7574 RepID=A0A1S3JIQ8_LINAN|nr:uncharacterized protein LOC106173635 [Lingula anatina]|eukprot:XP_013410277.1 uncharacterized protein LOC106173635 [Lingula anatina]